MLRLLACGAVRTLLRGFVRTAPATPHTHTTVPSMIRSGTRSWHGHASQGALSSTQLQGISARLHQTADGRRGYRSPFIQAHSNGQWALAATGALARCFVVCKPEVASVWQLAFGHAFLGFGFSMGFPWAVDHRRRGSFRTYSGIASGIAGPSTGG